MKNDNNETIVLESLEQRDQYLFITEEEFMKREIEAKNQEVLKKLKQEELAAKREQEEQIKNENIKLAKQSHLQMCITLYGQKYGELVAQEKVTIGMTTEMCLSAWGKPYDTSRTTTQNAVYEHWYYSWHRSLYFENGVLNRIED